MIPDAEKIGKKLLVQEAPELIESATKRKIHKQALKSTVRKTIKKQIGAESRSRKKHLNRTAAVKGKTKRVFSRKPTAQRSRSVFFTRVKNEFYFNSE